jgi:DNA-directed RNA polymerase subunit RPC12/RpoP
MSDLICITNLMQDMGEPVRACIDRRAGVGTDVPRPATQGWLCGRCWDQLQDAADMQNQLVAFLRKAGHYRVGEQEGHAAYGPSIPAPATWLAADEITRLSGDLWVHEGDKQQIVQSEDGAADAVRFTRAVLRANRRWPRQEQDHAVQYVRCRACGAPTLRWWPPECYEDDVTVQCDQCGNVESYEMLSFDARLLEQQQKERDRARRKAA